MGRVKKGEKSRQERRRFIHALLSAVLAHLLLLAVLELYVDFEDPISPDTTGTETRVWLHDATPALFSKNDTKSSPAKTQAPPKGEEPATEPIEPTDREPQKPAKEAAPEEIRTKVSDLAPESEQRRPSSSQTESTDPSAEDEGSAEMSRSAPAFIPAAMTESRPAVQDSRQAFSQYLQELLESRQRYPLAARRRKLEGRVEFSVYVSREGRLDKAVLARSSGSRILDRAARELLEGVFPVDYALPGDISTIVRITYQLQDA